MRLLKTGDEIPPEPLEFGKNPNSFKNSQVRTCLDER